MIENFSLREARKQVMTLGLVYDTSSDDLDAAKRCLDTLGPDRALAWLRKHPTDSAAFAHILSGFKDAKKRADGRKLLDEWLARGDIDWKTAAAQAWAKLTGDVEDLERDLISALEAI